MTKILVLGVGAIGAAAVALTLGSGTALADDDVVGQKYSEAKSTITGLGLAPVVASTVGDRKDQDDCIVTSATKGTSIDGYGGRQQATMNVNLNCYATNGTATQPGFSVASPQGQKQFQLDQAAKEQKEAAAAAAQDQAQQDQLAATDAQQGGE